LQEEGVSTHLVGGFEDEDEVVGTHGPVRLQAAVLLLGGAFGELIEIPDTIPNGMVRHPLVGKVE
jgi:hypothetical protein